MRQVKWSEVRETIGPGDLLLFRGTLWYSRIIQHWTASPYSHVGVAYPHQVDDELFVDILHSMEGRGVEQMPLTNYRENCEIDLFRLDPSSGVKGGKVVRWYLERRGMSYSSPRQFGRSFLYGPLCDALGLPTRVDDGQVFCSWAATEAVVYGGHDRERDRLPEGHKVSPGDLSHLSCYLPVGTIVFDDEGSGHDDNSRTLAA